ncbi:DoxX family protein [Streptomyces sp. bgisy154]|uniref:DoxX family protein n=1 Tax=Streptomyces sp. bgisy154 TaxID=3413794 RepID=UPI003D716162
MSETTAPTTSVPVTVPAAGPSAEDGPRSGSRGRVGRIALRSVQILLALFFGIASALPKLIAHSSAAEVFDDMGWGSVGMYTIGVLELAGAAALLVPLLQSVAAMALSGLMVGAFIVQLTVLDGKNAATPLIIIVPLLLVAWARRERNIELMRWVRGTA